MIYLDRFKTGPDGTFGGLVTDKGEQLCFTVERPETGDHPCIPPGIYDVEKYQSPKHGDVWQVMNVPGRTNIEMHPANRASELLGCIAPGNALGKLNGIPAVLNSQDTFAMLKDKLPRSFQLTVTGVHDAN